MRASSFVKHFVKPLSRPSKPIDIPSPKNVKESLNPVKQRLQALLASVSSSSSKSAIEDALACLKEINRDSSGMNAASFEDDELKVLVTTLKSKVVVALYMECLQLLLQQSVEVEREVEWWADVQRSRLNVARYFIQTLPSRSMNVLKTLTETLQTGDETKISFRALLPSRSALQPSLLVTSLFPHLHQSPQLISFTSPLLFFRQSTLRDSSNIIASLYDHTLHLARAVCYFFAVPYHYTRQECLFKKHELQRIRDEKARALGSLAQQRQILQKLIDEGAADDAHFDVFTGELVAIITGDHEQRPLALLSQLSHLASDSIPECQQQHTEHMSSLCRPSRLTRLWPVLMFGPPLVLCTVSTVYNSRSSLLELAHDAQDVVKGFLVDWLIKPLAGVLDTVRSKSDAGVIITKEGVAADFDSLERMSLALAKDHLRYTPNQLQELSKQIKVGDLTPVLKLYEEDIRSPLKSALTGTLLRTVFIQVQKAKVDLDQALAGIDRLLKSQQLTFAFVGVAPAFAIVYVVGGYIQRLWRGGRGRGRFGGKKHRARTLFVMRRIERLLLLDRFTSPTSGKQELTPLTSGLLILSVAQLRGYAERFLPSGSKFREGFLEDVEDLQDPSMTADEKRAVVNRMWRSWGNALGWGTVAEDGISNLD